MNIKNVFVSVHASDFSGLSDWWSNLLERKWDRQPMPSCHEWDLTESVFFQVLDDAQHSGRTTVTLKVTGLDDHVERLRGFGINIPDPVDVVGFDSLRYCQFNDPEGNEVGLLEGS